MDAIKLHCDVLSVKGLKTHINEGTTYEPIILKSVCCHAIFRGISVSSTFKHLQPTNDLLEINHPAVFTVNDRSSDVDDEADWQLALYFMCRSVSSPGVLSGIQTDVVARCVLDARLALVYDDLLRAELFLCHDVSQGIDAGNAGVCYVRLRFEGGGSGAEFMAVKKEETQRRIDRTFSEINAETQHQFQSIRLAWANARRAYPHLETRSSVKLIAEDECGQNRVVSDFVRPIEPPRVSVLSYGPTYCARFVSLVPFRRLSSLAGGRVSNWLPAHLTLLRSAGDTEDHAVLLCSLLLGWGMNAYVALGLITNRATAAAGVTAGAAATSCSEDVVPHAWVVTMDSAINFWEPLSGTLLFSTRASAHPSLSPPPSTLLYSVPLPSMSHTTTLASFFPSHRSAIRDPQSLALPQGASVRRAAHVVSARLVARECARAGSAARQLAEPGRLRQK